MKSRQPSGKLVAVDGVSGSALAAATRALKANGYRGVGISQWDASGIFSELDAADGAAGMPSARVILLLYAADLAFRLRWEIRPSLERGRTVIAAPYVDTAIAFGRAVGIPAGWLRDLLCFAPLPHESRRVAADSPGPQQEGFVEFACQLVSGARTGPFRDQVMRRARGFLKTR